MSRPVAVRAAPGGDASDATARGAAAKQVDWETFFEDPETGVVPLVMQARSRQALRQIYGIVVAQLFRRVGDEPRRQTFSALLDELMDPDLDLDTVKQRLCVVFRHIKEDRKARVEILCEGLQDRERRDEFAEPEPEPEPRPADADAAPDAPAAEEEASPRQVFRDVFAHQVRCRLDGIQADAAWCRRNRVLPPFLVSKDFADHWESLLRDEFGDAMADHFPGLLKRARMRPSAERRAFLLASLEESKYRKVVWETWQGVWTNLTHPRQKPARPPSAKQRTTLLGRLSGGQPPKAQMSNEDWKAAVEAVNEHNAGVDRIWDAILADKGTYLPPRREDGTFLMQLFGRSAKGLAKDMEALRQIAAQGGAYGRVFDAFQANKQLDVPLLAASFRYPGLFLDREKGVLATFLAGLGNRERASSYPLALRYLGDYLQHPASSEKDPPAP